MSVYSSLVAYPPEFDEILLNFGDESEVEDSVEYNPDELSPFELQYLSEYSQREINEALFYQEGASI